ncbi:MAG: hypothetical protein L3J08_03035 [Flavobacteriaceae bacterium]|nr:hypothetical protein [Flavobacteriaceae bacterium]
MELNQQAKDFLNEAAKWATLISIIGFIFIGLMVIISFSIDSILANIPNANFGVSNQVLSLTYLIIAGLCFIPVFFLYQFSIKTKKAIANNDTDLLTFGLKKLKSHYKFIGILMVILIGIYILVLFTGLIAALFT